MKSEEKKLNIGVLGDTHGHFALALTLLKRWENDKNEKLDDILQVGDLGAWPHPFSKLDEATLRFAKRDPDEISFSKYIESTEESRRFFDYFSRDYIDCPIIFIKGNHEDFEYLDYVASGETEFPIPLGYHGKFQYLPNGEVAVINNKGITLKVGGMGGLENGDNGFKIKNKEVKRLESQSNIDILLGHEPYDDGLEGYDGSEILRNLIKNLSPNYFFCGHCHEQGQELNYLNERTQCYILNDVNFRNKKRLNPGCVGILRWTDRLNHSFNFLEDEVDWTNKFTKFNFRYLSSEIEDVARI